MTHLFSQKHPVATSGEYTIYKKNLTTINKYDTICVRQINFEDNTQQTTAFNQLYIAKINNYVDKVGSQLDTGIVKFYDITCNDVDANKINARDAIVDNLTIDGTFNVTNLIVDNLTVNDSINEHLTVNGTFSVNTSQNDDDDVYSYNEFKLTSNSSNIKMFKLSQTMTDAIDRSITICNYTAASGYNPLSKEGDKCLVFTPHNIDGVSGEIIDNGGFVIAPWSHGTGIRLTNSNIELGQHITISDNGITFLTSDSPQYIIFSDETEQTTAFTDMYVGYLTNYYNTIGSQIENGTVYFNSISCNSTIEPGSFTLTSNDKNGKTIELSQIVTTDNFDRRLFICNYTGANIYNPNLKNGDQCLIFTTYDTDANSETDNSTGLVIGPEAESSPDIQTTSISGGIRISNTKFEVSTPTFVTNNVTTDVKNVKSMVINQFNQSNAFMRRDIYICNHLSDGAYNPLTRDYDKGIFFIPDYTVPDDAYTSNGDVSSGLVIAPGPTTSNYLTRGGIRITPTLFEVSTPIQFLDNSVQTTAFTKFTRSSGNVTSIVTTSGTDMQTGFYFIKITPYSIQQGVYLIEGVVNVFDITSTRKILAYLSANVSNQTNSGSSNYSSLTYKSSQIGVEFAKSDDNYNNFRQTLTWIVSITDDMITSSSNFIYINVDYKLQPSSELTSSFEYRMMQLA